MPRLNQTRVANWLLSTLTVGSLAICVPRLSHAHFHLDAPPSWAAQNTQGNPQKSGPCGESDSPNMTQAVATNVVTPFQPGQTIDVIITETVMHPGHYRVALATERSLLPADPPVTAGATACGSTVIDSTPEFPVLVDGALVHTAKFSGPQTIKVTLPTNITCSKCTLQVIEFMSSHGLNNPGGCFYHHCADISIQAGGAATGGTGGGGAPAAGAGGTAKGGAGGKGNGGTTQAGGASAGASNGGASATGGTSNGGVSATGGASNGGATGNGGAPGASGGSSGGLTSTGGSATTTGGAISTGGSPQSGGVSAGGVSAGAPSAGAGAAPPVNDAGCGCALPGRDLPSSLPALGALLALAARLRRRRR